MDNNYIPYPVNPNSEIAKQLKEFERTLKKKGYITSLDRQTLNDWYYEKEQETN
jgi:hypothetical protein